MSRSIRLAIFGQRRIWRRLFDLGKIPAVLPSGRSDDPSGNDNSALKCLAHFFCQWAADSSRRSRRWYATKSLNGSSRLLHCLASITRRSPWLSTPHRSPGQRPFPTTGVYSQATGLGHGKTNGCAQSQHKASSSCLRSSLSASARYSAGRSTITLRTTMTSLVRLTINYGYL